MEAKTLKKSLISWTISGYILLIWATIASIITTRLLFLGLGDEAYGFWILLWSVFGYTVLLDFGFGTTVQKYAAELTANENYERFNTHLSTIFGSYFLMSGLLIILSAIGSYFFENIFSINSENLTSYQSIFFIFGLGSALLFPMGVFSEVLKGIGKINQQNIIRFITVTINVLGVYLLMEYNYSVLELTIFTLTLNFCSVLVMGILSFIYLPKMRLSYKYFKFSYIKEIISFSFFAYLVMFANMIINRTDQIVLGVLMGMSAVAIYQIGSRLSFLFNNFATQFQNNLTPIAAKLHHSGEQDRLGNIMYHSNRIVMLFTSLIFIILVYFTEPLLFIWLGVTNKEAILISYIMLFSVYFSIIFRSVNNPILLMGGKHKFLSKVAIYESIANILLSIILVKVYGVIGVAIGTLVPNLVLGIFLILPSAAKYSAQSISIYIQKIFMPVLLISSITFGLLVYSSEIFNEWNLLNIIITSIAVSIIYLIMAYIFYIDTHERKKINVLMKKINIKRA